MRRVPQPANATPPQVAVRTSAALLSLLLLTNLQLASAAYATAPLYGVGAPALSEPPHERAAAGGLAISRFLGGADAEARAQRRAVLESRVCRRRAGPFRRLRR